MNSLRFLSSLPDASGKSLLRKLGFGYMLSPMVAYTSRLIYASYSRYGNTLAQSAFIFSVYESLKLFRNFKRIGH